LNQKRKKSSKNGRTYSGKAKGSQLSGKLGYIFFTICIGLVCFYIGRVEFLAEKLQEAEKYQRMARPNQMQSQRSNQQQQFPDQRPGFGQVPVHGPGPGVGAGRSQNQAPVRNQGRPMSPVRNPFSNQDPNVVNQRDQTIKLWQTAEEMVQTRTNVVASDLSAAATVNCCHICLYILFIHK